MHACMQPASRGLRVCWVHVCSCMASMCSLGVETKTNASYFKCLLNFPKPLKTIDVAGTGHLGHCVTCEGVRSRRCYTDICTCCIRRAHIMLTRLHHPAPNKYPPISTFNYWVCASADPVRLLAVTIVWLVIVTFPLKGVCQSRMRHAA